MDVIHKMEGFKTEPFYVHCPATQIWIGSDVSWVFPPIPVVLQDKQMFVVLGSCPSHQNKKF